MHIILERETARVRGRRRRRERNGLFSPSMKMSCDRPLSEKGERERENNLNYLIFFYY